MGNAAGKEGKVSGTDLLNELSVPNMTNNSGLNLLEGQNDAIEKGTDMQISPLKATKKKKKKVKKTPGGEGKKKKGKRATLIVEENDK